jgi:hypothetical protein
METLSNFTSHELKGKKNVYFFWILFPKTKMDFLKFFIVNLLSFFPHVLQNLSLMVSLAEVLMSMDPQGICLNRHGC